MARAPMGGTVTADDVAARAGVSRWTVNRAFKKDASISEKSLQKVMQAAEELGYAPDLQASSLASDRSNLVALVVDDFANPHKLIMMEALTRKLREGGWDTILVNTLDADDASTALLQVSQRRVDAAILIGVNFNDQVLDTALGAQRVRKLIVFARFSGNPNTISICCIDETAMAEIAQHVLAKGYKRPLFLAGPQTISAHLLRKETFLKVWQADTGHVPDYISVGAYDPQQSYQRVTEHLSGLPAAARPDIIVCENDALALGASDAVRYELGLRIPQDIAVTGFDDVPFAANPNYNLTTYRQPILEMVDGLVRFLKGEATPDELCNYTGHLVVRDSA